MPRGPKGERRPADVNARAVMVAKIATGEPVRRNLHQLAADGLETLLELGHGLRDRLLHRRLNAKKFCGEVSWRSLQECSGTMIRGQRRAHHGPLSDRRLECWPADGTSAAAEMRGIRHVPRQLYV